MKMKQKLESNLRNMMLYNVFSEPFFWGPILILTLQHLAHMTLEGIYVLEALCIVLSLLIDIPTGALSDMIGRKKMLIIAQILLFLSFLSFAFMEQPWHAWVANIFWGVGYAFKSGTDKALIQETCIALKKENGFYRKYIGKAQGYRLLLMAICSPIATWLGSENLRIPLYWSIPTLIIPLVCVFLLSEPPREIKELTMKEHVRQMKKGLIDTCSSNRIVWITLYACVIGTASKIWFFTYNPYCEKVGLQLSEFGTIFFFINLVAWLSSIYGQKIEEKMGEKTVVYVLIPIIGIPILVMGMFPLPIMAYCVLFQNVIRGMSGPFIDGMTEKFLKNETRATVLSVQSSIIYVFAAAGLWMFGKIVDRQGLFESLMAVGIITLISFVGLMLFWKKVFRIQK
jgi:MFS family permease